MKFSVRFVEPPSIAFFAKLLLALDEAWPGIQLSSPSRGLVFEFTLPSADEDP